MDEDGDGFSLQWGTVQSVVNEEVICTIDNVQTLAYSNIHSEGIPDTDQMAAENLMTLAHDVVTYVDDPNVEYITEEVITDDWVQPGGQERVEVSLENFTNPVLDIKEDVDIDVPLPTDQDEYTAMRPWPCDFCSRRFRKKAALMNHMVVHQNDPPHACNLCGVRYVRKFDLMNHLKDHAFVPDNPDSVDFEDVLNNSHMTKPKKKRGRRKKKSEENGVWEHMTSARTQQWSRRARSPAKPPCPPSPPSPPSPASLASPPASPPPSPPSPSPPPADPSRPFVCRQCGIGFAREKALQSHARVHGGESPVECGACGELCWSREALSAHCARRHPHTPRRPAAPPPPVSDDDDDDDADFELSPARAPARPLIAERGAGGPELFCSICGVAFQRADLLRRHVHAAHSYIRHDSVSSYGEHTCDVCGEVCADALQLLAHAERHSHMRPSNRFKRISRGRNSASTTSGSRQFPCRMCGKVFGSRSSQQIHVRIHTGERPYACRFCWKAFADGGTLRKHERIHTGEKPYACAVCPRAFNQRVVLREHVRSHHSAPDRRANGVLAYSCAVCSRSLTSSDELVQHLIQHCDANTALKRQPQSGPRKYKRRRKLKRSTSPGSWRSPSVSPARSPASGPGSPVPSPEPPPRRQRRKPVASRPKMIHTEEPKRGKTVVSTRQARRPPRHPADDLRAIRSRRSLPSPARASPPPSPPPSPTEPTSPRSPPSPPSPMSSLIKEENIKNECVMYRCEMCSMEFDQRDALLLHVPIHI